MMLIVSTPLVLLFFSLFLFDGSSTVAAAEEFKCLHHLVQPPLSSLPIASRSSHTMASSAVEPIRIYVDYSPLANTDYVCSSSSDGSKTVLDNKGNTKEMCKDWNVMTEEKKALVKNLVPQAIAYLERTLLVVKEDVDVSKSSSCGISPGNTNSVDADLYLMVGASVLTEDFTKTLAYAYSCGKAVTGRNNIGVVNFNAKHLVPENSHSIVDTALHEITHVLGFTGEILESKMSDKKSRIVDSNRVVAAAREYFGCDSYSGIPVENDGGSGSKDNHWERSIVPDELMCAAGGNRFSNITISFLEDLGYYRRNDTDPFIQNMVTGKKAGCEWKEPCGPTSSKSKKDVDWFAEQTKTPQCTLDYTGIGIAQSAAFAPGCYFLQPYNNRHCAVPSPTPAELVPYLFTFATDSRCIASDMRKGDQKLTGGDFRCFSTRCPGGGRRVEIRVDNHWYACPFSGQSEKMKLPPDTEVKGEMTCPAAADFCDESTIVGSRENEEKPLTTAPLPLQDAELVLAAGVTLNGSKWEKFLDDELKRIDIANSIRVDIANVLMTSSLYIRVRRISVVDNGHLNMLFGLVTNNETAVNPDRAVDVLRSIENDPSKIPYTNIGYNNDFYISDDEKDPNKPAQKDAEKIAVVGFSVQGVTAVSLCGDKLDAKNCLLLISLLVLLLGTLATLITMYCICCRNPFKYPPAVPAKKAPQEKYGPY